MDKGPDQYDLARLIGAAIEAQSALEDYIPQLEKAKNASLNYGKRVLKDLKEALKRFQP